MAPMILNSFLALLLSFHQPKNIHATSVQSSDSVVVRRLSHLCKIGGVVKTYYATRNYEYDKKYISAISKVINNKISEKEYEAIIGDLLLFGNCEPPKIFDPVFPLDSLLNVNFNFDWFDNVVFSNQSLRGKINNMILNIKPLSHKIKYSDYYSVFESKVKFDTTDVSHNLFLQFGYWNIINYFFYYKNILGVDWNIILDSCIAKSIIARNGREHQLIFKELTSKICDSHVFTGGGFLNIYFGTHLPGFSLVKITDHFFIKEIIDTNLNNLHVGDEIIKINGKRIDSIYNSLKNYVVASNNTTTNFYRLFHCLLGQFNESMELTLIDEKKVICLRKYAINSIYKSNTRTNSPPWHIIESTNFGYIDLGKLKARKVGVALRFLRHSDGLILDLRSYPNNSWKRITSKLSNNKRAFSQVLAPDLNFPGKFKYVNTNKGIKYAGRFKIETPYKRKICVLIDERTISHGEYSGMALSTIPNIKFIGKPSAGSDGGQVYLRFPNSIYTSATLGSFVLYPDSKHIQGTGLKPDINVTLNVNILRNVDPILSEALKYLGER
jgi:hypothetical protein